MVMLGAGESGTGAACLAVRKGYDVFVSDKGKIAEKYRMMLQAEGIAFEEGRHSMERILAADEVIKKPGNTGIRTGAPGHQEKGIPVVGELEFGFRHCHGKDHRHHWQQWKKPHY